MNLAIDIGNSITKMAIVANGQIVDSIRTESADVVFFNSLFEQYPEIDAAIIVSTRDNDRQVVEIVKSKVKQFIYLDKNVKVPIKNCYKSPETLGHDRLAGAVAAHAVYPKSNILIIDFGTAITFDFVNAEGEFEGGTISPGVALRFRALNEFTSRLPLCELPEATEIIGKTTTEAIQYGVINGIIAEVESYITTLKSKYPDIRIVFTGGNGDYFAKRINHPIFATRDLVVYGLNRILEYNAE